MKFTLETTINKPVNEVIALFDNPDNLRKWMKGLETFEHLSGNPGQPGARSRLKFIVNGRSVEMIETITTRNLPEEFSGTYETKSMMNIRAVLHATSPSRSFDFRACLKLSDG